MKKLKVIALPLVLTITILFASGCSFFQSGEPNTDDPKNEEPTCNHEYGDWVSEENKECHKKTYTKVCEKCGDTQTRQGSAEDHDWKTTNTVPATCGEDGYSEHTCQICDKTEQFDIVKKTGNHSWSDPAVMSEPTCGESGFSVLMCFKCQGNKLVVTPATGDHSFGADGVCTTCGQDSDAE